MVPLRKSACGTVLFSIFYSIGKYDLLNKNAPLRIALRREGIMSLKRPAAGGESRSRDSFYIKYESRCEMNRVYEMGSVKCRFTGHVGDKIDQCIANGVMKTDYRNFVEVFRKKTDSDGLFCGEFWGKWFTSAVLA